MAGCRIDKASISQDARGRYNRVLHDLKEVGATPQQVFERSREHERRYSWALTPPSLMKYWAELAPQEQRVSAKVSSNWSEAGVGTTSDEFKTSLDAVRSIKDRLRA